MANAIITKKRLTSNGKDNFISMATEVLMKDNVTTLQIKIDNMDKAHTDLVSTVGALTKTVSTLAQLVDTNNTNITKKITEIERTITALDNRVSNLISYSTSIPSSLSTGQVHLQYF